MEFELTTEFEKQNKKQKPKKTKAIMIDENGKQKVITVDIIELTKDFKCIEIDLIVTV